jgi:hypothetical protein
VHTIQWGSAAFGYQPTDDAELEQGCRAVDRVELGDLSSPRPLLTGGALGLVVPPLPPLLQYREVPTESHFSAKTSVTDTSALVVRGSGAGMFGTAGAIRGARDMQRSDVT